MGCLRPLHPLVGAVLPLLVDGVVVPVDHHLLVVVQVLLVQAPLLLLLDQVLVPLLVHRLQLPTHRLHLVLVLLYLQFILAVRFIDHRAVFAHLGGAIVLLSLHLLVEEVTHVFLVLLLFLHPLFLLLLVNAEVVVGYLVPVVVLPCSDHLQRQGLFLLH